jgi:hypothetical protein
MPEAGIGRAFKAFRIQNESAVKGIPAAVQTFADFFGVSHLRDPFGIYKRGYLDAFYAGIREHPDNLKLFGGRHRLLLILEAVTQTLLFNYNFWRIGNHNATLVCLPG